MLLFMAEQLPAQDVKNIKINGRLASQIATAISAFSEKFQQPLSCFDLEVSTNNNTATIKFMPSYKTTEKNGQFQDRLQSGCGLGATYVVSPNNNIKKWNAHR